MQIEAIPNQKKGASFDVHEKGSAEDSEVAVLGYETAKARLFDVTNWGNYAEETPDMFILTNGDGEVIKRPAKQGDHIKIHLPGPRSAIGDGADWVVIEKITEERNKILDEVFTALTIRPCPNPQFPDKKVAHFYDWCATNTLIVCRHKTEIIASVHGRNEVVNTDTDWVDLFRNMLVALPAKAGLSNPHWKKLAKGLLPSR